MLVIKNRPSIPMKEEGGIRMPKKKKELTDKEYKMVQHNELAKHYLFSCMSTDKFSKVMACETTKQIWDQLELTYEGINRVKDATINLLLSEYEIFTM